MPTTAITFHETHGVPPRLYHVTFGLAGERVVDVSCDGVNRQFRFTGKGYRPTKRADRLKLIEKFTEREASEQPIERMNAELLHPTPPKSGLTYTRNYKLQPACECHDDRQLPKGDRT